MKKIKSYLAVAGLVALAVGITYFVMKSQADQRVSYLENSYQKQLDSMSVVARASMISRAAIEDSLTSLDEKFAEYVTSTNQKIASYTTIIGQLRIEKDQLQDSLSESADGTFLGDLVVSDTLVTNRFRDTLVSRTSTWSDSLFATTAVADFKGDSLYLNSDLRALRNPRIDVAETVSDDGSQVNIFVRSPDFDSLEVRSTTEIKPEKSALETAKTYFAVGGVALVIKEAITIIKKLF